MGHERGKGQRYLCKGKRVNHVQTDYFPVYTVLTSQAENNKRNNRSPCRDFACVRSFYHFDDAFVAVYAQPTLMTVARWTSGWLNYKLGEQDYVLFHFCFDLLAACSGDEKQHLGISFVVT